MRLYAVKLEPLSNVSANGRSGANDESTCRMSSSFIQPATSLLFFNTRREAPMRRYTSVSPTTVVTIAVEAKPLAPVSPSAPAYSRPVSHGPWRPRPRSTCPSSRSSSSSTSAESSVRQHPLNMISTCSSAESTRRITDVQFVSGVRQQPISLPDRP